MPTAVAIVWCLLTASVAIGTSDGLQIVSRLNDPLLVRGSRRFSLRALCSVICALICVAPYSQLQESCCTFTGKGARHFFCSSMTDESWIRTIVTALEAHEGILLSTKISTSENDGSFTYYAPGVIGVDISAWGKHGKKAMKQASVCVVGADAANKNG